MNNEFFTREQLLSQAELHRKFAKRYEELAANSPTKNDNEKRLVNTNVPLKNKKRGKKGTRLKELVNFLKSNGAMTRKELIAKNIMPEGSIAYLLNDKKHFTVDEKGRWSAIVNTHESL